MMHGVTHIAVLLVIIIAGVLPATGVRAQQQKVQFTQYMFNGMVINPAYAGAEEALSLTFIHRRQWSGVEDAPSSQTLSAHTLFKKRHLGLGITLTNDKIGVHNNMGIATNYAYHLKTGREAYLSFGLQAGVYSRRSDYASIMNGSTNYDPKLSNPYVSATHLNFGAGLYFRTSRFQAGLSAPELIPERYSLNDSLSIKLNKVNFFLLSRYRFTLSERVDLEPSAMLKYLAGVPVSYDINLNMTYRKVLTMGVSYRKKESVDFLLRAQITPQLQLGYAYDYTFGDIANLSVASHELMVHYLFKFVKQNVSSPR